MSNPERHAFFPPLPDPYPRLPDYVPDPTSQLMPDVSAHAFSPDATSPAEAASLPTGAAPESSAQQEREPRLTVHGRVGSAPTFRTTAKGQLLARFPLGVHPSPETTTWYSILAFGARAEKLRDATKLVKGQEVEVMGYLHTREAMNRKGTRQTVEEIYAVAVRT